MEKITHYFNQRLLLLIKGNAILKPTKVFDKKFKKPIKNN